MARQQDTVLHPLHAPTRSGWASAETLLTRVLHTIGAATIASCRWPLAALRGSREGAASGVVYDVFSHGVQALPLVCVVGAGAGAGIVLQTGIMAPPPSGELGRMLVVVVLRELTPLVTAIVVAGHSGAALATAHDRAGSSRVLGMVVSMLALTVYFGAVAIIAGYLVSQLLTLRSFEAVRDGFQQELRLLDLPVFLVKGAGLGAIVAWSAQRAPAEGASMECHGSDPSKSQTKSAPAASKSQTKSAPAASKSQTKSAPAASKSQTKSAPAASKSQTKSAPAASTQPIAMAVRRAFATSLLACMAYSGAVTVIFYALVGPPAPP